LLYPHTIIFVIKPTTALIDDCKIMVFLFMKSFITAIVILATSIVPSLGLSPQEKYEEAKKEYFDGNIYIAKNILHDLLNSNKYIPDTTKGFAQAGLGRICFELNDFQNAIPLLYQSIKTLEDGGYEDETLYPIITLGRINYDYCENIKAVQFFEKALNLAIEYNNWQEQATCYINIGACYYEMSQYSRADEYYNKAFEVYQNNEAKSYDILLPNMVLNILENENYKLARKYLDEYIVKMTVDENNYNFAFYNYAKGMYYLKIKEYDSSIYSFNLANQLIKNDPNYHRNQGDFSLSLAEAYMAQGKYEMADSLLNFVNKVYLEKPRSERLRKLKFAWFNLAKKSNRIEKYFPHISDLIETNSEIERKLMLQRDSLNYIVNKLEKDLELETEIKDMSITINIIGWSALAVVIAIFLLYANEKRKKEKYYKKTISFIQSFINIQKHIKKGNRYMVDAQGSISKATGSIPAEYAKSVKQGNASFEAAMAEAAKNVTAADPIPGGDITGFRYDADDYRIYFDRPTGYDDVQVSVANVGIFDADDDNNYIELSGPLNSGTYATKGRAGTSGGGWNDWGPEEILIVD
jgi:tetratricopeptide (TPR) repeat protein